MADCLPQPEIAPWPEEPVGMFKDILETGVIRQLVQGVPETPANTSWYFSGISQAYQAGVFAEIEKHYGVKLKVESVVVPPGRIRRHDDDEDKVAPHDVSLVVGCLWNGCCR